MEHLTNEISREQWREYFDNLSRELPAVEATVEVDGSDIGAQLEADGLVVTGLSYDDRDDVFVIALEAPGGEREDLEHMISAPQRVFVDSDAILPDAIEVQDADGRQTIVHLRRVPELPAG